MLSGGQSSWPAGEWFDGSEADDNREDDMSEPLNITPGMIQPRTGDFPLHRDTPPGGQLPGPIAKLIALQRLAEWRRKHGRRD